MIGLPHLLRFCFVILIIVPLKPLVAYTNNVAALILLEPFGSLKARCGSSNHCGF